MTDPSRIKPVVEWRVQNCHEPKVIGDRKSCPVCWGKGRWPAISDRQWAEFGGSRGCDYTQRCGYCRATGHVKAGPADIERGAFISFIADMKAPR